ncbi:low-temperature viability protein ltv1 [Pyrenophora tritici-repentis]|uniref:Low-temperature viability protein ltv1 n=2 Tax=Pyrenophora tritici-repentis TaxID=45151 RepID=A0A2W1HR50_9PLEO|nr:low-temperature viability protein ltv1 [Pyrenophora tritici-repentis Pt-1C-BFP]KAA8625221.1 Low-temperature viability protein ltv1 [Pyrenophora tritici-repentis]EDU40057.1 low-temperature viability protein ltv1 [Pyrenophora tritici-repentis Pt-1C-BFP]KAF7453623.1 Low-temperature viability protein ltv1 [Pyrenophora tritici-repentis]KAF7576705.1 low-temperature viability protein ltv1 [Pyrenophora tritici-repentis]KAG9387386.1 Low-temperature viability protein ltv1 [Pyrenophora tritici-repenti
MARGKFIDKKTATNFRLVHRAQNDPRIHDDDAPQMVFAETVAPNQREQSEAAGSSRASQYSAATGRSKIKSRRDLESEYASKFRRNEGEAANYGIYYDDTEYDYMQHMRDLGSGGGEAYFVEAKPEKKGKQKMDLADMLRDVSLNDSRSQADLSVSSNISSVSDMFGEDMAPSEFVRKTTYQDQQNIPDALAGFQPDMDPRLREVLEALEDEAYVDDEEDIFNELAQDGYEVDQREWNGAGYDEDDRDPMDRFLDEEDPGWETDDTIKASSPKLKGKKTSDESADPSALPAHDEAPAPADASDMAYLKEFKKFKEDVKASKPNTPAQPTDSQSFITGASALTAGGRRKKRKGAKTSTSNYSMSSSALHRTEGLTLLDQRFDKIEEEYADDGSFDFPDDASMISGMSKISGLSKMSGVSQWSSSEAPPLRSDFDSIMDDFLGSHHTQGKRRVKKGKQQSGLEQLEEVRKGLGAPKIAPKDHFSVLRA